MRVSASAMALITTVTAASALSGTVPASSWAAVGRGGYGVRRVIGKVVRGQGLRGFGPGRRRRSAGVRRRPCRGPDGVRMRWPRRRSQTKKETRAGGKSKNEIVVCVAASVLAGVLSVGISSVAGASGNASAVPTIRSVPALPSNTVNTASPSGAIPNYGVLYCDRSTVSTEFGTITTERCIKLISATEIYFDAYVVSGASFVGHQHVAGGTGISITSPNAAYSGEAYYATGPFGNQTYCDTLWKLNSTGHSYRNMGSVCT